MNQKYNCNMDHTDSSSEESDKVIQNDVSPPKGMKIKIKGKNAILLRYTGKEECIEIPPSYKGHPLTKIADFAFENCYSLKNAIIPDSITEIGVCAFHNCQSLEHVDVPPMVNHIGDKAFKCCKSLIELILPPSMETIENGVFSECTSLTTISIPAKVKMIGQHSFQKCESLASVTIPPSVISIGIRSFYECKKLKSIDLPHGVTEVGREAFAETSIDTISLTAATNYYEDSFPKDCKIIIPGAKTPSIEDKCSLNVSESREPELDNITKSKPEAPSNNTDAGAVITAYYEAFQRTEESANNSDLIDKTNSIMDYIVATKSDDGTATILEFKGKINNRTIPEHYKGCKITAIADYAFYKSSYTGILIIPESIERIGDYAFSKCNSLTQICLPDSLKEINPEAFSECKKLENITLPPTLKKIRRGAFRGCLSLKEIALPPSLEMIEEYAFIGTSLKNVALPEHTKASERAFPTDCRLTTYREIEESGSDDQTIIDSSDTKEAWTLANVLNLVQKQKTMLLSLYRAEEPSQDLDKTMFEKNKDRTAVVVKYDGKKKNLIIPNYYHDFKVTGIEDFAFQRCSFLEQLSMPDSIERIGRYAFNHCKSLKKINIPPSVREISPGTFYCCDSLFSISLPSSVKKIGHDAFSGCKSLSTIILPPSLSSIGSNSFSECESLKTICIPPSVTNIGKDAFAGTSLKTILVPKHIRISDNTVPDKCVLMRYDPMYLNYD